MGPHALTLMNQELLDAQWYQVTVHILECAVGLMIGTELVWNKIKKSGKAIVITTFRVFYKDCVNLQTGI